MPHSHPEIRDPDISIEAPSFGENHIHVQGAATQEYGPGSLSFIQDKCLWNNRRRLALQ